MRSNILILALFLTSQAFGAVSAVRHYNEPYEVARNRNMPEYFADAIPTPGVNVSSRSVEDESKRIGDLQIDKVAEIANELELNLYFKFIRDTQFFNIATDPFPRRISWLYPDDGCYVRAEIAYRLAEKNHYAIPSKVFVFGNLRVKTANAPGGSVGWWYHVAPAFRVQNEIYILDPAMNPEGALKIADWNERMKSYPNQTNMFSICSEKAMYPSDKCSRTTSYAYKSVESDQFSFLKLEWKRLVQLKRNPNEELNQNPPWSH